MKFLVTKVDEADKVQAAEKIYIDKTSPNGNYSLKSGLALSGGGIRSASFSIGILQALQNKGLLRHFSYLSTVSGGGYCGSALTWFQTKFKTFPFGALREFQGGHVFDQKSFWQRTSALKKGSGGLANFILSYIRQHGNFLIPYELGKASFISRIIFSMILSALSYLLVFGLVFFLILLVANMPLVVEVEQNFFSLFPAWAAGATKLYAFFGYLEPEPELINFTNFFGLLTAFYLALYIILAFLFSLSTSRSYGKTNEYGFRILSQEYMGFFAQFFILTFLLMVIPLGFQIIKGTAFTEQWGIAVSTAAAPGLIGLLIALNKFLKEAAGNTSLATKRIQIVAALFVLIMIFGLLSVSFQMAFWIYMNEFTLWLILIALGIGLLVDINKVSPHMVYRDRLMETFLWDPTTKPEAPLKDRGAAANQAKLSEFFVDHFEDWTPYHLINTNMVITDGKRPKNRERKGDNFILSPLFCGSPSTGYVETKRFMNDQMTLADAMATSGAAANPNAGVSGRGLSTNPLISFLMQFFGIRLGFWAVNPDRFTNKLNFIFPPNFILPGIKSLLGFGQAEKSFHVELSDGGHFDNTALYELIRRRVDCIVFCDGSADPDYHFDDLGFLIERVRVDFKTSIYFEEDKSKTKTGHSLEGLYPGSLDSEGKTQAEKEFYKRFKLSREGLAVGKIFYPEDGGKKAKEGKIYYFKPVLLKGMPSDIYSYKEANPTFPHQSTVDQFFDERQFEAYRELGYRIARDWTDDLWKEFDKIISKPKGRSRRSS